MVCAYFITVETRKSVEVTKYTEVANSLVGALFETLGNIDRLQTITKTDSLIEPKVEVEVSYTEASVVASAVVQAGNHKLAFDKTAFSTMLKAEIPALAVSISKRAVED